MKKLMSLIVVAVWTLAFAPAEAGFPVNCPGAQIMAAFELGETDLTVNGTCVEDVLVISDDVTITGGGSGVILGSLVVRGAQRFKIQNMNVIASTSGLEGIWVTNGASATIFDVMVSGDDECAILVFLNSFAEITNSEIGGGVCGLSVGVGSLVSGSGNVITNSVGPAVEVYQQSTYRARNETFESSTGSGPTITLDRNSFLDLRPANVTGDIAVNHQAHLSVRRSSIVTGDISVNILSELDLRQNSEVEGNINATNLSIVRITDGATVDGRVSCFGTSICTQSK